MLTALHALAANQAVLRFECAALAPDTFLVHTLTGEEAISRPFRFELDLLSTEADVPGADVVGKPATLKLVDRNIQGTVSEFEQTGRIGDYYGYRVTLVPRLWVLSLSYQSRIYQKLGIQDILKKVLEAAGLSSQDYRFELTESYAQGEYVSQYQETDLDFISRLMEHRGIFYFFEHTDDHDVVVISDKSKAAPRQPDDSPVPYNPATSLARVSMAIHVFDGHEKLVPGQIIVKDYNYRTPDTPLVGQTENNGYAPAVRYEYGGHCKNQQEADWLARIRSEEIECGRRVFEGAGDYHGLQAGYAFTLERHFRERYNGDYVITSVRHTGSHRGAINRMAALEEGDEETYANTFTCIPLDVPYRPSRHTPVPKMPSVTTARVETSGGKYAHVDEEGRYHAKMAFDLSDETDGEASRPIRMSQPYSGAGYGMHFPNHADTELLVAHMNDDPDRPMAIGTVPNPSNASPVSADNKHQSVIRTQGGNSLVMDDTDGEQKVTLSSTAANLLALDDGQKQILLTTTNLHALLLDDENKKILLSTTDGHILELSDEANSIKLMSKAGHTILIDDPGQKIVVADASGSHTITVDIGGSKIIVGTTGSMDLLAPDGTIDIQATTITMTSSGDTTISAGANLALIATDDGSFDATNIAVAASADLTIDGASVTSTATGAHDTSGATVTSGATSTNDVSGATVTVEGTAVANLKGGMVNINS